MTPDEFTPLIARITESIGHRPLDDELAEYLNAAWPPGHQAFEDIRRGCREAIDEGWMCNREAGGIRFGRALKPSPAIHDFSVDVVIMKDVKGPHHRHPSGEIDMVMPLSPDARFDGHGVGWCVYGPDTAHHPTVTDGEAIVLYLLPKGEIEFTKQ
ncbi:MAG: DUF4863 family protein [Gammaproteobacteria bacterium]|nr:DUF4863 family protein [Gammaproteobacteria bacterium]